MKQQLALVALLVKDYDEAITYYTQKLSFALLEDTKIDDIKRWVVIAPKNSKGCGLLLAKASTDTQVACVGNQTGGRVFLFLHTANFWNDYREMNSEGITFTQEPREEPYGTVAVFKDLYGNLWDLIQPKSEE